MTDTNLSHEENFIIGIVKDNGNSMNYKSLQMACENEFEGVRLILKKLKDKGFIDYEGNIPGFNSEIKLVMDP